MLRRSPKRGTLYILPNDDDDNVEHPIFQTEQVTDNFDVTLYECPECTTTSNPYALQALCFTLRNKFEVNDKYMLNQLPSRLFLG